MRVQQGLLLPSACGVQHRLVMNRELDVATPCAWLADGIAQHGRTHAGLHAQVMGPWQVWERSALAVERHKHTHHRTRRRGCLNVAMALSVVRTRVGTVQLATGPLPDTFIHEFIQVLTRVSGRIPHAVCLSSATGMQARQPSLLHVHEGKGCAAAAHFQWQAYMTFDVGAQPTAQYALHVGNGVPNCLAYLVRRATQRTRTGACMKDAGSCST